ncbi:hypothetical protein [Rheinheimera sp.]|uniref:hypothetical protein n=1 Tax=Rheinheimera sp. TaxID=1869214 RepID=UPI0027B88081|nr:hypothetical protein [Rheinheimera sp.]
MESKFYEILKTISPESQIFVYIAQYGVIGYLMLLVIALIYERKLNSITISIFVVYLSWVVCRGVMPLLYDIASGPELYNKFAWYGSWIAIDVFCVWLIYYLHQVQKLRATQLSLVVSMSFIATSIIQAIDFIDRATLQSSFFASAYQVLIAIFNTGMLPLIAYFWLVEIRKRRLIVAGA